MNPDDLRVARLRHLDALSDEEFAAEVREHQRATWRGPSLLEHAKKHRDDFEEMLGRVLPPSEIEELSRDVLVAWDRLFTSLHHTTDITYYFASQWSADEAILVAVTRGGRIRTMIPIENFSRFLVRHPALIEVTDRGKHLGL